MSAGVAPEAVVYLLHFQPPDPLPRDREPLRRTHYVGRCSDFPRRLWDHANRSGRGAQLPRVAVQRGYALRPALLLHGGSLADEQTVKRAGDRYLYCPACGGDPQRLAAVVPHLRMEVLPDVVPVPRGRD